MIPILDLPVPANSRELDINFMRSLVLTSRMFLRGPHKTVLLEKRQEPFLSPLLFIMAAALIPVANPAFIHYLTDLHYSAALRNSLIENGITDFDDLKPLAENEINRMCTNIRRQPMQPAVPAVPPRGGRGGRAGRAAVYPVHFPILHERRLVVLAWYLRHLDRVQRDLDVNVADADFLDMSAEIMAMEEQTRRKNLQKALPEKMKSVAQIRAVVEDLDDWFECVSGASGAPLAYVTRATVEAQDYEQLYDFDSREMIARAPHTPPYYTKDNAEVWSVIRHVMYDTEGWSWISQFERARNGRAAYFAIKDHYLGTSNRSRILMLAERALENTYYEGDKKSFTFEKFCSIHKQAHKDLADYNEPVSEISKVRKLLKNIRSSHLAHGVGTVLASDHLCQDFDRAVNFLTTFAASSQLLNQGPRNIAGANSGHGGQDGRGGGRGRGRGGGRNGGRGGGGRGRGRGRGRGGGRGQGNRTPSAAEIANFVPHAGYIDVNLWYAITEDQREAVRKLRDAKGGSKRTIEEVETAPAAASNPAPSNSGDRMSQRQKN